MSAGRDCVIEGGARGRVRRMVRVWGTGMGVSCTL